MQASKLYVAKTRMADKDLDPMPLGTTAVGEDSDVWQGFAVNKHHCCSVLTKPLSSLCRMAAAPDLQTSHQVPHTGTTPASDQQAGHE